MNSIALNHAYKLIRVTQYVAVNCSREALSRFLEGFNEPGNESRVMERAKGFEVSKTIYH